MFYQRLPLSLQAAGCFHRCLVRHRTKITCLGLVGVQKVQELIQETPFTPKKSTAHNQPKTNSSPSVTGRGVTPRKASFFGHSKEDITQVHMFVGTILTNFQRDWQLFRNIKYESSFPPV